MMAYSYDKIVGMLGSASKKGLNNSKFYHCRRLILSL